MLEVTSDEPQLWRMAVLEDWDRARLGRRGRSGPAARARRRAGHHQGQGRRAAQPDDRRARAHPRRRERTGAARTAAARAGASPGRRRPATPTRSPARSCTPPPSSSQTVQIPARGTYDHVTQLWPRRFYRGGDRLPEWIDHSPWGEALRLAESLEAGTTSQLEVVRRVEDYLNSGRYRYTTDVEPPGEDPLLEFLFITHAGYCQHFAGAAALLLRLAGVPTRVVTGFATGKRTGADTYSVRDEDAHAVDRGLLPGLRLGAVQPDPVRRRGRGGPRARRLRAAVRRRRRRGSRARSAWSSRSARCSRAASCSRRRRRRPAVALGEVLASVAGPVAPSVTLQGLRPRLAAIGPSVAALADDAERARFARRRRARTPAAARVAGAVARPRPGGRGEAAPTPAVPAPCAGDARRPLTCSRRRPPGAP